MSEEGGPDRLRVYNAGMGLLHAVQGIAVLVPIAARDFSPSAR